MIKCFAPGQRKGANARDCALLRHHGAENSALKNSAPSSFTTRRTSDSTSIVCPGELPVLARILDGRSNIQAIQIRSVDVIRTRIQSRTGRYSDGFIYKRKTNYRRPWGTEGSAAGHMDDRGLRRL